MTYFLKKTTPSSKGVYLQIYQSYYVPGKGNRNKSYQKIGYIKDLIDKGIDDPISYFQKIVDDLNLKSGIIKDKQIGSVPVNKNLGIFLVKSMFDKLNMDNHLNIVGSTLKSHYMFSDLFRSMVYAQILSPGSKLKAYEKVIPTIYGSKEYSYDQILDFIEFIGMDYHKYIEVLNYHINKAYKRDINKVYFDCTNYYFEIDLEDEFRMKGPSKEERHLPLVSQALLLDSEQIPLDTEFFPGNESEKPYLRKVLEEMKDRNEITGRIIEVADKGLNCARNIYSAVIEANDGYIFSKSIKGRNITEKQKEWILYDDNKINKWVKVYDNNGDLIYKYKVAKSIENGNIKDYGTYSYKCKLDDNDEKETIFTVKEKRILTYNPSLARKQKQEIMKEVEKAKSYKSYKDSIKEDIGSSAKYLNIVTKDENGKKVKVITSLNQEKIDEDLMYAGYNLLITSEINEDPEKIYKIYHNLWRIEESFRVLKTYLEARPVFLSNKNSIIGHFTICYISLALMRLLELKVFNDEIPIGQLFEFIRQYYVTENYDGSYINASSESETYFKVKEKMGLSKLGNVYLSKRDTDNILNAQID